MKAPISEKLKQTLKLGLGEKPAREPDFRKVDDYYIAAAELRAGKALTLQLASDMALSNLFRITYDVASLTERGSTVAVRPRVDYYKKEDGGQTSEFVDLLAIAEIQGVADVSKIMLLGVAVLSKMRMLGDPATVLSRGQLQSLEVEEKKIVSAGEPQSLDFEGLFQFLRLVASCFTPTLQKLKEKTPVKDEIIIRQELAVGGQRKEHSVRLEHLRSQLASDIHGKKILDVLGA
jgi:hypothetical protein